jgi:hypothetical protein
VNGISYSGAGVHGKSELGNGISGLAPSYGGNGVYGENTGGGVGVYGVSASVAGIGVYGDAPRGSGVVGNSEHDIGVQAISPNGTAFQAQGRVAFSTSGLETVPSGASQVTIAPGTTVQATTIVLCTLECSQVGISIERLTKDTSANTFKVFLSKKVASGESAKVAWFVIG